MNPIYSISKRSFDIICSILGIVSTSPLWALSVIGIKISDPGPVFYKANRIGKNNKTFKMYKFRSMRQGKANEAVFRGDEDRIFPFGHFLRTSKIDELPQLLNILAGSMSIVGPRPAAVDQASITRGGKYEAISSVKCGLTGPSALFDYIYGDHILDSNEYEKLVLPNRLNLDLAYLEKMSPTFDIKMIYWTVICILAELFKKQPDHILETLVKWAEELQ